MNDIRYLIKKELSLELKSKHAVAGVLLYVISTTFVCYLSFKRIVDVPTWNALFWIIILFAATNAVAKSFLQESEGKLLYLYTLTSPQAIILSKIIYNAFLITLLTGISTVFYILFLGNLINDLWQFLVIAIIGSIGFSSTLTLISAISSKASNNPSLMAILGFPIILPLLMTTIHASKNAIDGLDWSVNTKYLFVLIALNAIISTLSYLLFPYIWRD